MSRHSFSARLRPTTFTPVPATTPRTGSPFLQIRFPTQTATLTDPPHVDVEEDQQSLGQPGVIPSLAKAELAPREIEIRIGQLIHASLNGRSTAMAAEIVRHIEALCAHPDDRRSPGERCVLRRLAGYWRQLAWITANSAVCPSARECAGIQQGARS